MSEVLCETTIDVQELCRSTDPALRCIDVRSPTEFAAGHIPAAIDIPMDEIESRLGDLRHRARPHTGLPIGQACRYDSRAPGPPRLRSHRSQRGHRRMGPAGLPLVASTQSRWSLERQVRLGAGLLVLTGVVSVCSSIATGSILQASSSHYRPDHPRVRARTLC